MNASLNNVRISIKLPVIIVLLSIAGIATTGYIAGANAERTLREEGQVRLASLGELQGKAVASFLRAIDHDLESLAQSPGTIDAITKFTRAYADIDAPVETLQRIYIEENPHPQGERDQMYTSGVFMLYDVVHGNNHPFFHALQQKMGYYDVFLFDTAGNLVYSVFKEPDFATNMLEGEWQDTGLAEVYRRAMELEADAPSAFVDFEAYAPRAGEAASFIARPVFNAGGTRVGVIAYQMPAGMINDTVSDIEGIGETGDAFLVGADHLLRTDSRETAEHDILVTRAENAAIDKALSGEAAIGHFPDQNGDAGLWAVEPVEFHGTTWALVLKQDSQELFAPLGELQRNILLSGLLVALGGLVLAIFASRSIAKPVTAVNNAMKLVSDGTYDIEIPAVARGDEIGGMARTLENFRKSLQAGAAQARENAFRGTALENSNAAVMMTGTDLNVTWVNTAMRGILGVYRGEFQSASQDFNPEAIVGSALETFLSPDIAREVRSVIADPTKLPYQTQLAVGAARFDLAVNYVPDADGKPLGYIVEWDDVTEMFMKNAIVDSIEANQVKAEFAMSGELTGTNAHFCTMLDQEPGCMLGRNADEVFLFDEADAIGQGTVFDRLNQGENVFGRFRLARNDGSEAVVEGGFTPVMDVRGQALRIVLIGNDVTEARREIEAAEARQAEMTAAQQRVVETLRQGLGRLREGDLTVQIVDAFSADYEQLRQDFNAAVEHLLQAMRGVIENAEQIRSEASEISNSADHLSLRTERQAATLEETASALNELTTSVKSAAEGAANANTLVEGARKDAEASGEVVREAVEAMSAIAASSEQISKITDVIEDIAFQTNLLALNAGVEAARAGDAGRGFAVVASEVRALAQRSSDAAHEINKLIAAAGGQVKRGVELVDQTGSALKGIVDSVKEISRNVSDIAVASREQSSGLVEINDAMSQLDQVTQQNAAMFEETTAASHALTRGAEDLAQTTSRFRTGQAEESTAQVLALPIPARSDRMGSSVGKPVAAAKAASSSGQAIAAHPEGDGWDEF